MTSQVMALRRSGRLMVRVSTGPSRSARRSPPGAPASGAASVGRVAAPDDAIPTAPATAAGRARRRRAPPATVTPFPTAALLSFRLGGLRRRGRRGGQVAAGPRHARASRPVTVAGAGPVDRLLPGLRHRGAPSHRPEPSSPPPSTTPTWWWSRTSAPFPSTRRPARRGRRRWPAGRPSSTTTTCPGSGPSSPTTRHRRTTVGGVTSPSTS